MTKAVSSSACSTASTFTWRLQRKAAAEQAFANIFDYSLTTNPDNKLAVKFLFNKNSSQFDRRDTEYPMGVRQITQRTAKAIGCLEIEPDWACRSQ